MSIFDGRDLVLMMHDLSVQADACLDQKLPLAREAAEAEGRYRAARAAKLLDLTTNGMSVSQANVMVDGNKKVIDAKVAWRCAEAVAEANDDAHLLRKKELGIVAEEYARQWAAAGVVR